MAKIFLTAIGVMYLLLAAWSALQPARVSEAVGLDLQSGSSKSEFFVFYVGVELALGIILLWPLIRPEALPFVLTMCVVVHAAIAVSRSVSLLLYSGVSNTTYTLAAVEWAILIAAAYVAWRQA